MSTVGGVEAAEAAGEIAGWTAGVRAGAVRDYLELTKPRLTSLVALTALVGYRAAPGEGTSLALGAALVGTTLLAAGGCVLNQVMERDFDALMDRTKNRPVPAGRLTPFEGNVFGWSLAVLGLGLLAAGTNLLTLLLGVTALVSYLWVYTPMKRTTAACTLVGALPGALPPAMGWAAATGTLDPGAWAIFGLLFLWQLPHFLAIAWMRRDDYARGGFAMLTVVDPDGGSTGRQVVLHCLALLPVSLLPARLGIAGPVYFATALLMGLIYLAAAGGLALRRTHGAARALFLTSLVYLPLVLTVLMLDEVTR